VASEIANTAYFSRTFDEALALVVEARDYVAGRLAFDREVGGTVHQLTCDGETLRLTARLTHVMAWLFIQRAFHAGEITAEEMRKSEHRLGGHDVCLADDPEIAARLPKRLRALSSRSLALYQRIARLDEAAATSAA
jgi:regulator of CtrA degradation